MEIPIGRNIHDSWYCVYTPLYVSILNTPRGISTNFNIMKHFLEVSKNALECLGFDPYLDTCYKVIW